MSTISLPPTDSIESVLKWFSNAYKGDNLESNIKYLTSIMEIRRVHINDFYKGRSPCGWQIKQMSGSNFYHEDFNPDFTPDVLIREGIFGGLGIVGMETHIPIEWVIFPLLKDKILTTQSFPEQSINHYSILAEIYPTRYGSDSRKFFHWFCLYYLGKRSDEDRDMIDLWNKMGKYRSYVKGVGNSNKIIMRQMLLQWGYSS